MQLKYLASESLSPYLGKWNLHRHLHVHWPRFENHLSLNSWGQSFNFPVHLSCRHRADSWLTSSQFRMCIDDVTMLRQNMIYGAENTHMYAIYSLVFMAAQTDRELWSRLLGNNNKSSFVLKLQLRQWTVTRSVPEEGGRYSQPFSSEALRFLDIWKIYIHIHRFTSGARLPCASEPWHILKVPTNNTTFVTGGA